MAAMLVEIDGRPFAVPIDRIERTVRLADHTVRSVAGAKMLVMRDGVLPIVDGGQRLCRVPTPDADHGVIVRTADSAPRPLGHAPGRPARARHPPAAGRGGRARRP